MRCQNCGKEFVTANKICPYCKSKNIEKVREQPIVKEIPYHRIRPSNPTSTIQPTEWTRANIPPPPPNKVIDKAETRNVNGKKGNSDTFLYLIIAGCSVLIFFIWLGVMGASSDMDSYSGTSGNSNNQFGSIASTRGELEILESHPEVEGDFLRMRYVVGTAKNVGGKRISYGSIEGKFYDKYGNLLSTQSDYVQDLEPGETWKFKILYGAGNSEASTYKVEVGSTW